MTPAARAIFLDHILWSLTLKASLEFGGFFENFHALGGRIKNRLTSIRPMCFA